jgi:diguanylate cyclase (GGDEF)-like protein
LLGSGFSADSKEGDAGVYGEKENSRKTGSAQHVQILAGRAGIVYALFVGFNAWFLGMAAWQWIVGLAFFYAAYNMGVTRRQSVPGASELLVNLAICTGFSYFHAEYSSILYQLLLLRMVLRGGRRSSGRLALVVSTAYLAAVWLTAKKMTIALIMPNLFNLIGFAIVTYVVIHIEIMATKQATDDKQMLELIKQNDRNYRMALTDALTGLYNHRAYKEKIDGIPQYVLLIIDIDHFKKLNDTYGHLVGDKVLVTLGNLIKLSIRSGDLAFRYGGEEFVLALPGTTLVIGLAIAERLRQKVADWSFEHASGRIPVTISIGMSQKRLGMSSQTVFEQADSSLYHAKQSGRNNVQTYVKPATEASVNYGI